MHLIFEGFFA